MIARYILVGSVLAAVACAHAPVVVTPRAAVAAPTKLATLLEKHCVVCHDEPDSGRPDLRAADKLDAPLILLSAQMVAAERMPPRASTLGSDDRAMLVRELCKSGAHDVERCIATAQPKSASPFIREVREFLRAFTRLAGQTPPKEPGPNEQMLIAHPYLSSSSLNTRLNVTFSVLATLVTMERCPAPSSTTLANDTTFAPCAKSLLDLELMKVLPPPESQPARGAP